jgi:protein-tyrosine phosphatase
MFNFFKTKPTLTELIPSDFVDIHSHILPGIDDGAKNINESLSIIKKVKKIGFSKIITTPHTYYGVYNNTNNSIKKSYEILDEHLDDKNRISYASEYMLDTTILEKIKNKSLLCLKDNYVLVEMSFVSPPINLYEIIFELQLSGYIPVIAHPERYRFFHSNFKDFERLKRIGCKFQLNLLSTIGFYGKDILDISEKLLSKSLFDFVGSDIHNNYHAECFNEKIKIKYTEKLENLIDNNKHFL